MGNPEGVGLRAEDLLKAGLHAEEALRGRVAGGAGGAGAVGEGGRLQSR